MYYTFILVKRIILLPPDEGSHCLLSESRVRVFLGFLDLSNFESFSSMGIGRDICRSNGIE